MAILNPPYRQPIAQHIKQILESLRSSRPELGNVHVQRPLYDQLQQTLERFMGSYSGPGDIHWRGNWSGNWHSDWTTDYDGDNCTGW